MIAGCVPHDVFLRRVHRPRADGLERELCERGGGAVCVVAAGGGDGTGTAGPQCGRHHAVQGTGTPHHRHTQELWVHNTHTHTYTLQGSGMPHHRYSQELRVNTEKIIWYIHSHT